MSELNWPTIGVCWALTTATTVILFVVYKVVVHQLRKRRILRKPVAGRDVWSTGSDYKSESGQTVPLMEVTSAPSKPNGLSSSSSSSNRPTNQPAKRRTQDDVSRWCSEHGLPEGIVYTLREQGFETKAALDALRPEDLEGNPAALRLPSPAVKVQLRQVLTKLHANKQHSDSFTKSSVRPNSGSSRKKPESFSDSALTSEAQSPTNSSDVFLHGLTSIDEVDGRSYRGENGKRQPTSSSSSHRTSSRDKGQQCFHGLLSDEGLWRIANKLGHEWRELATLLHIAIHTQEQLSENHPRKVKNAIYEMLTMWRNDAAGTKEQIKCTLHKALVAIERNDIAKLLMDEQTRGSNNNIQSISSII